MDIYKMYLNNYSMKKIAMVCGKPRRYIKKIIKKMRAIYA